MNRTIIGIFVGTTVLYAILSLIFAINGFPCFFQDALCFLPTSYFINHQHQLINPLYDAGIDPITHKFLFYPPLFPYSVAMICKLLPDNYNQIHIALTLIDICSIIIMLKSAYIYIKKSNINYNFYLYLFLIIWTVALFSFHGVFDGRPEILSDFFIACFILNNICKDKRFFNFINGALIGLNAINSPISTFYLVIITAGIIFYNNNLRAKSIIQTVTGFVIIFGCFALVYPYHLIDLFQGLIKHSTHVVVNRAEAAEVATDWLKWIQEVRGMYFITPFHVLAGVSFLVSIFYTLFLLIKQKKVISILCFILLFALIDYFAFKNVLMSYNTYVLSPIYMFVLLVLFIDILNKKILVTVSNTSVWILVILLFINSLGLFRTALMFFSTQDKKVPINEVGKEINFLSKKLKKDKKIYITFSLWPPALDKANSVVSYTPMDNPVIQFIILQQSNSGQNVAPQIAGFKLIKNGFIPEHPKFGKIQIGNTYPYYQTAIYEKE
ncbi:hypothetical protein [Mucilaginibacter arboris]|uniref:Glycosyltransferase RgtA/B/C/D-like domain-containing protein n=1 Tax=Mucilaginibacter arboris TaxID=2682090 RepID=A0A7K1SX07_9SPHI|nr:hypothetical protein [Mucilaginibacter arboris]MVN21861.1 hypothetical protein [Mucilaginibacter arboris]